MFLTTNQCDGTASCKENCPTKAIRLINNKAFSCITCGICFNNCPNDAIFKNDYGGYVVDRFKCNGCGICQYSCPINSIHIENGIVYGICVRCGLCVSKCPNNSRVDGFDLVESKKIAFLENLNLTLKKFSSNHSSSVNSSSLNSSSVNSSSTNSSSNHINSLEIALKNKYNLDGIIKRNSVVTDFNNCILCGRCQYYCPTDAIIVHSNEKGVCTKCRICEDNCPSNAISNQVIDNDKCVLCLNCIKKCPNDAIIEEDYKVTIQKSDDDITGDYVSCLNCGLCSILDKGKSLSQIDGKMRFDPSSFKNDDLNESIKNCPVSTLNLRNDEIVQIKGYCVSCGKCVQFCDLKNARSFKEVIWDGTVSEECISCGTCAELCPRDAITLKRGSIIVDNEKCILCETCAIHCPKDAIIKSTSLKKIIVNGFNLIDLRLCVNCKLCYNICPEEAIIDKGDDGVELDEGKCIYCGACKTACPSKAFLFEREFV
ncbi:4Fe-4S binding protein [Methanobrevibacter curvatus]|uniref:NAD(P)H-quinone oxidoreductase subunit I, chloroplastic n=1 Tax=Methanobrevibacter curvatus TaxID=49547 RepID=A0A166C580_9EURY|nr:4Fe-4S binding protein [Methanobrevibacter curvatus]KZX14141.1 NAD(P)H-quinone oxidoreductase subunit I, chloroplastic [Methanobrevibacter curvatus]